MHIYNIYVWYWYKESVQSLVQLELTDLYMLIIVYYKVKSSKIHCFWNNILNIAIKINFLSNVVEVYVYI